jgi:SAM-dependent methyltransferase
MRNNLKLETISCPLCQNEEQDVAFDQFSPYNIVRCCSCGFYYLSPRLTETSIIKIYKNGAYFGGGQVGYESYIEQERALRATFHRFMLNLKNRHLTGGALLEVGCGYGYLLEEAKGFFGKRIGTELSHHAVELASKRADYIYEGGIDQLPAEDKFDCIMTIQVMEHIYQPRSFLENLYKHLKPGGKMVIVTPDMGCLWRRLMGQRWPAFKIPEHILYFNRTTLRKLMREVGLVNIKSLPYPHAFPLSLVAAKLNISLPSILGRFIVWIPAATLAMVGVSSDE